MSSFTEINKEIDESTHLGYRLSLQITRSFESQFEERAYKLNHGVQSQESKQMPEEAFKIIKKFMDKCEALKGPDNYDRQAISSDLARACAFIPVESPEMAADLIKTTDKLFEMRSDGDPKFQLETFAKQGRFLGDKKVAEEYLNATAKNFDKLNTPYDSCISALEKYKSIATDHPEMAAKIVETVSALQDKFADNPYYKECTNDILKIIADNEKVAVETRNSARDKIPSDADKAHLGQNEEKQDLGNNGLQILKTEPTKEKEEPLKSTNHSVKDKAKDFIKGSKSYAGGKKLFTKIKDKIKTFAKENPKLLIAGGAAAVFAGIGTVNPELAAAGTIIMMVGIKEFSERLKNMRGLSKTSSSVKTQAPRQLNRETLKDIKSRYGR